MPQALQVPRVRLVRLALPVLRHRLVTNFHAEAERVTSADLIGRLIEAVDPA